LPGALIASASPNIPVSPPRNRNVFLFFFSSIVYNIVSTVEGIPRVLFSNTPAGLRSAS